MRTSVLINTYNHRRYLTACLDSVFSQVPAPDEVIVYDDGSADGSRELLHARTERFTLIAGERGQRGSGQENQANAIHQAFLRSTGELVFLLDGDDCFRPGKLARYVEAFGTSPRPVMIQSPMVQIDPEGREHSCLREERRQGEDLARWAYARHDLNVFYPSSALAFSREFLERNLPIDCADGLELFSDERLGCAALLAGRIVTLAEPLTLWRRHPASLTLVDDHSRGRLLGLTWRRTRLFNRLAAAAGRPQLSVWRNRRFYLQLARLLLPQLGSAMARWRSRQP